MTTGFLRLITSKHVTFLFATVQFSIPGCRNGYLPTNIIISLYIYIYSISNSSSLLLINFGLLLCFTQLSDIIWWWTNPLTITQVSIKSLKNMTSCIKQLQLTTSANAFIFEDIQNIKLVYLQLINMTCQIRLYYDILVDLT